MRAIRLIIGLLVLCSCATAQAKDCEISDNSLSHLQPPAGVEFTTSQFAASEYTCAIHATQILAASLTSLPGTEGIDARFALREMAIDIGRNTAYPSEPRVALLRAAAISLTSGNAAQIKEEIQADARMLFMGGKILRSQKDTTGWLDMLTLAIRLDRQLADADRRIAPWELGPLLADPYRMYKHFDRLAILAELTRGDKLMEEFRSRLVHTVYFYIMNWREDDTREVSLERCKQLLRLTGALDDVTTCYGCPPEWRWWPIMKVGAAYKRQDMTEEAKTYVEQAIQIVRSNPNPDYRLGGYRFVLSELVSMPYDRKEIFSFVDEMRALANSLNTPLAKEVLKWIPELLERSSLKR